MWNLFPTRTHTQSEQKKAPTEEGVQIICSKTYFGRFLAYFAELA